jgi:hypothetical protein
MAKIFRREWTGSEMMKLLRPFRPQFTQELNGIDLDDIPIFRREGSLCQQDVNGLAGADEHLGLFAHMRHGGTPYETAGKEWGKEVLHGHKER